jgi:hypothetical protein
MPQLDWFSSLFGFEEAGWAATRDRFAIQPHVDGDALVSRANGRQFGIGRFSTPRLADLREATVARGTLRLSHEVIGDVLELHGRPENAGAMFQVASQFNCLEFVGPHVVPEDGVSGYAHDPTQGPACSLAAAAATVYRNYFAPVGDRVGQTADAQLNNLDALAAVLPYFEVRNGYTFASAAQLAAMPAALARLDREALLGLVKIGVHSGVEVTFGRRWAPPAAPQSVSQAFCAAVSCAYTDQPVDAWAPLATLALDAAYEATLRAAAVDVAAGRGSGLVWLTFLGGGVFGNRPEWIAGAIRRAAAVCAGLELRVKVAHYRGLNQRMIAMIG